MGSGGPGDQLLVQRMLWAALPGEGSPPGNEGKGNIFFLIQFSYIPCVFDLKKACMLLMWARLNIVGNGSLKFLSGPAETAG